MATFVNSNVRVPINKFIEPQTGRPTQEWLLWLMNPSVMSLNIGSALPIESGGTGLTTLPTNGQLLIGNAGAYTLNTLTAGAGVSVTNGAGTITLANTGVLSFAGSTTGLTPAAATTGAVTLGGTLVAANGGTGLSSYSVGDLLYASGAAAISKLGIGSSGYVLTSTGTAPSWAALSTSAVTSFSADSTGLTPATATTGAVTLGGVLNETHGGTNQSSYAAGDLLYASASNTLSKLTKPSAQSVLVMSAAGVPSWKNPKYGAFHDTSTQTAAANTPTAITFNATDVSNGVTVGTPTSRIVIAAAGLYNIQFSIQFTNTSVANIDDMACWLRVNGSNVANSASWVAVPVKHAGRNGQIIMALNLFYTFAANDYFELIWMTVNGTGSLETIAASGSAPVYPAAPSAILTVSDNIAA